jgi:predicted Zn-dependent peptidase
MSNIVKHTLPNGVRVLVEPVSYVRSAAIGLWCKTGSRHERDDEAGITHLIEHMLFKGTRERSAKEIAESIEGRGGALNAFTDKESTCYYCRVLQDDVENGLEVLSDMMLNSLIEAEELGREKNVVLEEIKRGEDEPGDHVHDLHLQNRWPGHPLGKPIIGTRESVSSFARDNLTEYMSRRYRGGNVILSVAGNVDPEAVRMVAERLLSEIEPGDEDTPVTRPVGQAKEIYVEKDVEQVHFCIGSDGCSLFDDEVYTMAVLDSVLGGGMSSRLFQEIREKRGLAYSVGSYTLTYSAGGAFTVYGGTGASYWSLVQELVRAELDRVIREGVPEDELERNKRTLTGHILLALEGMNARMMRMAKNELHHRREIPIEETMEKIQAVDSRMIQALAEENLASDRVSTTVIGPPK